jgi:signal peptidase I
MRQFFLSLLEVLEILCIALISIYITYTFIAQPFRVEGSSMEPNFSDGNYLIVDELSYRFKNPGRGEVVVLRNPTKSSEFFIKRIVGLPGEEVVIRGNEVYINGELIKEKYLPESLAMKEDYVFQLKDDQYFVMGDNRLQSYDSRSWGPLSRDGIVGVVRVRLWPMIELENYASQTN